VEPLTRLVSSKRTLELTPHQLDTWVSALSIYNDRPKIVNRAILELSVSDDPFPDLSKLLAKCEYLRRVADNKLPQDSTKITFRDVTGLAKAWGIEV